MADVFYSTCDGSGIFLLSADGDETEIVTGEPVCHLGTDWRLSPGGRSMLAPHLDTETRQYVVAQIDLDPFSISIHEPFPDYRWVQDPVWMGDEGSWAFVSEANGIREVRRTESDLVSSRTLFSVSTELRLKAWDSDRDVFRFWRYSSQPYGLVAVVEIDSLGVVRNENQETEELIPSPSRNHAALLGEREGLGRWKPEIDGFLAVRDLASGSEVEILGSDSSSGTIDFGWVTVRGGSPGGPLLWAPDGSFIVVGRVSPHGTTLWRVAVDGSGLVQLTTHDLSAEPTRPEM